MVPPKSLDLKLEVKGVQSIEDKLQSLIAKKMAKHIDRVTINAGDVVTAAEFNQIQVRTEPESLSVRSDAAAGSRGRRALCDACAAYVLAPDNGICPNCGNPIDKDNYDPLPEPPASLTFRDPPVRRRPITEFTHMIMTSDPGDY
jgi:hypothetical protein